MYGPDGLHEERQDGMTDNMDAENHAKTEWGECIADLIQMKDWPGVADMCRKRTESEPENGKAWFSLGIAYAVLKRNSDAVEAFRQAVRINTEDAAAWCNLANGYRLLERYDDSIEAYRQALRITPEDAKAWFGLGNAFSLSGNRTAALDAVRELRRLDPAKADKLFNLIVPR